jgi:hypothetical protein
VYSFRLPDLGRRREQREPCKGGRFGVVSLEAAEQPTRHEESGALFGGALGRRLQQVVVVAEGGCEAAAFKRPLRVEGGGDGSALERAR